MTAEEAMTDEIRRGIERGYRPETIARAAIAAAEAAGFAVVPVEPTKAMVDAALREGVTIQEYYRAMLAAARG